MPNGHDIIVIGASSGGVEALKRLMGGLPADLPAAVFVVVHMPEEATSALAGILDRAGPLIARNPEDGEGIQPGVVYVARPNRHLLVQDGRARLTHGPKENRHRPAVDALFRSAAVTYGPRVVGVVLTGARDDGTAGLLAVKRRGGIAVVQDPKDALFDGMPASALRYVDVDHRLPLDGMASLLSLLSRKPAPESGALDVPGDMDLEARIAGLDPSVLDGGERPGELSAFTCPECSGPLFHIQDGGLTRFRCRVGHAHTADSALDEKSEVLENALYVALNSLDESAMLSDGLASRSRRGGQEYAARRFEARAREAREKAGTIRRVLMSGEENAS